MAYRSVPLQSLLDVAQIEANQTHALTVLPEPYFLTAFGGQRPNSVALSLLKVSQEAEKGSYIRGIADRVLGTSLASLRLGEARGSHAALLDRLGIRQPAWTTAISAVEAIAWAAGRYPVLVRPSFILSGTGVAVASGPEELASRFSKASQEGHGGEPVSITALEVDAYEVDVDAVAVQGELVAYGLSGHLEEAGVHSGDATLVMPAPFLSREARTGLKDIAVRLAKAIGVSGVFNVQCLVDKATGELSVIETNLRASRRANKRARENERECPAMYINSHCMPLRCDCPPRGRSLPFLSKALGIDMAMLATAASLTGLPLPQPLSTETRNMMREATTQQRFCVESEPCSTCEAMGVCDAAALGEGWKGVAIKVAQHMCIYFYIMAYANSMHTIYLA